MADSKLTTITAIIEAAHTMRDVYRTSRCPCGCGGSWAHTVSGTIGGQPTIWMGCARRNGAAVGGGLTGDQYHIAHAVIAACEKLNIDIGDVIESATEYCYSGQGYQIVVGPLALAYEREILARVVSEWATKSLSRRDPEQYLASRQLSRRDIDIDDVCDGIWTRPMEAAL